MALQYIPFSSVLTLPIAQPVNSDSPTQYIPPTTSQDGSITGDIFEFGNGGCVGECDVECYGVMHDADTDGWFNFSTANCGGLPCCCDDPTCDGCTTVEDYMQPIADLDTTLSYAGAFPPWFYLAFGKQPNDVVNWDGWTIACSETVTTGTWSIPKLPGKKKPPDPPGPTGRNILDSAWLALNPTLIGIPRPSTMTSCNCGPEDETEMEMAALRTRPAAPLTARQIATNFLYRYRPRESGTGGRAGSRASPGTTFLAHSPPHGDFVYVPAPSYGLRSG